MSNLGGKNVSEDTDKDASTHLQSVVAGTNVDNIDNSDPTNPVINVSAGGGAFKGVLVERSTTVARTAAGLLATFDTEVYDTDNFADLGSSSDRVTVPAGVTRAAVNGHLDCTLLAGSSNCYIFIAHYNSSDVIQRTYSHGFISGNTAMFDIIQTPTIDVTSGDYFTLTTLGTDSSWSQVYVSLALEYKDGTL